jgi:hypothetical protein
MVANTGKKPGTNGDEIAELIKNDLMESWEECNSKPKDWEEQLTQVDSKFWEKEDHWWI